VPLFPTAAAIGTKWFGMVSASAWPLVSFRFISFHFVSLRFISFRFVSFRFDCVILVFAVGSLLRRL